MAKYDPLARLLTERTRSPVTFSFDEISELVGGLPKSAFDHQAWWANSRSHPNAAAWLDAGWQVVSFDQRRKRVTFRRVRE